ncbi:MAG: Ig-like domain-containing protein [Saprospiraceae bacterium]|nr:Ig-like domain-containing protein [Saprospiraceae bacterium]
MKTAAVDSRQAFDAAHEAAVEANSSAGQDVVLRQDIEAKQAIVTDMDRWLPCTLMYVFTFFLFIAALAEAVASWEFYKLFLSGKMNLGFFKIPLAYFGAALIVLCGLLNAHLLRTLRTDIAQFEMRRAQADNPNLPLTALKREVKHRQQRQHRWGIFMLIAFSVILGIFSYYREVAEAASENRPVHFTLMDCTAILCYWLEIGLGVYLIYAVQHAGLSFRIGQLLGRSRRLRAICQENTHLVAASVVELDQANFDWKSDNEIQMAMLRYQQRNSSTPNYTDPIVLGKTSVLVRDAFGNAVSDAQVLGITELDKATSEALTNLNGNATLNWFGSEGLKTILVNGLHFDGLYQNGSTVVLVLDKKRPIGF